MRKIVMIMGMVAVMFGVSHAEKTLKITDVNNSAMVISTVGLTSAVCKVSVDYIPGVLNSLVVRINYNPNILQPVSVIKTIEGNMHYWSGSGYIIIEINSQSANVSGNLFYVLFNVLNSGKSPLDIVPYCSSYQAKDGVFATNVCFLADINNNGKVDITDVAMVSSNYGKVGEGLRGDINLDGKVDVQDVARVSACYGFIY